MKKIFFSCLFMMGVLFATAQLKTTPVCPVFEVNILNGTVTGMESTSTAELIMKKFPCYTSVEAENDSSKCGGIVSYKDNDIYFYTGRDYIELRENFKGKQTTPVIGASRNSLFQILGGPKIKDVDWDAYQTSYGILVLHYNKDNKVNLVQFSKKTAESLKLCE